MTNTLANNKDTYKLKLDVAVHNEGLRIAPRVKGVTLMLADRTARLSRDEAYEISNALVDAAEVSAEAERQKQANRVVKEN